MSIKFIIKRRDISQEQEASLKAFLVDKKIPFLEEEPHADYKGMRLKYGLTLRDIQSMTGISSGHMSEIENKKIKNLSIEITQKLKSFFASYEADYKGMRLKYGLTLRDIQSMTGISSGHMSEIENKKIKNLSIEITQKLKSFFASYEADYKGMRLKYGLSLGDIQSMTGISSGHMSQIENKKVKNPTIEITQKLNSFFASCERLDGKKI